jgi:hypothetical protein
MLGKCRELAQQLRVELPNDAFYSTIERTTPMKVNVLDLPGLVNLKNSIAKSTPAATQPPASSSTSNATSPTRKRSRQSRRRSRERTRGVAIVLRSSLINRECVCRQNGLRRAWSRCDRAEAQTSCGRASPSTSPSTRPRWRLPRARWTASPSTSLPSKVSSPPRRKHQDQRRSFRREVACEGLPADAAHLRQGQDAPLAVPDAGGGGGAGGGAGSERQDRAVLRPIRQRHQRRQLLLRQSQETAYPQAVVQSNSSSQIALKEGPCAHC